MIFSVFLSFWFIFYGTGSAIERHQVRQGIWPDREGRMSSTALLGTLLHAAIVILAGLWIVLSEFSLNDKSTTAQNTFLLFTLSWFVIDTLWIFFEKYWKMDLIIHHFLCLLGLVTVLNLDHHGWIMTATVCIGEMGPCFYLDVLAKRWKYGSTRFYRINDTAYVIAFSLTRFVLYTGLAGLLFIGDAPLLLKIAALALLGISYYWAVLLIKKYRSKWPRKAR